MQYASSKSQSKILPMYFVEVVDCYTKEVSRMGPFSRTRCILTENELNVVIDHRRFHTRSFSTIEQTVACFFREEGVVA